MAKPNCREKILDAAVDVLHRRGFNGCGVQHITDLAGVPKGSFYNHFSSKEVLGAAAVDRFWQSRTCGPLRLLSDETRPPLERLRAYFTAMAAALAQNDYACGCLVGNMSAELSDHSRLVCDRLCSVYAGWSKAVERCVREGQRTGAIVTHVDAGQLADFLVNAWQGTILRARVDKDDAAFQAFDTIVFTALTPARTALENDRSSCTHERARRLEEENRA